MTECSEELICSRDVKYFNVFLASTAVGQCVYGVELKT